MWGRIRDVEYGHAQYVLHKHVNSQYVNNRHKQGNINWFLNYSFANVWLDWKYMNGYFPHPHDLGYALTL